ncbi:MAG: hypothetical protein MK135_12035 [Polyangiaceae bacterium]|nr:hypothetical protein [Polyangiaceae bacterium]
MSETRRYSLEAIRTDGWFERIGDTIGSFQALCDILGAEFFAFAMITGARITSLTVDRRIPENTRVEFSVGEEDDDAEVQSIPLGEFRKRLVGVLVQEEPLAPAPTRDTDVEGIQQHLGVRYLLLAPVFGYSLETLVIERGVSHLELRHDGIEETYPLAAFRARLRTHVRQELERASRGEGEGAIDLARVTEAEIAADSGDHAKVIDLLGGGPGPLAMFLRTPEGQMLGDEARSTVARGLGLLGTACASSEQFERAEEVLRLAVQYAGEGPPAADVYFRLGQAYLAHQRAGEAIGPLRRAASLGGDPKKIWPELSRAFLARERYLAAWGALRSAQEAGVPDDIVAPLQELASQSLGAPLQACSDYLQNR